MRQPSLKLPRTPWADPDLQGTWDFTTITPLQRPAEFAGQRVPDGVRGGGPREADQSAAGADRGNVSWIVGWSAATGIGSGHRQSGLVVGTDGRRLVRTRRTSLVVDPPDGRIPPLSAQAQAISRARDEARAHTHTAADLPLAERCIMGFNSGPPMVPGPYNNLVQIFQSPGYVVIVNEMVHDARVVPLDSRPHLATRSGLGRRLARPLGGRYARCRDTEPDRQRDRHVRPSRAHRQERPSGRALHQERRPRARLPIHGERSRRCGPERGAPRSR